ncbi:MAG TPA: sodium-translocating pyrophosphatase [Candidatus Anoxymicrobiaceae bacterium]
MVIWIPWVAVGVSVISILTAATYARLVLHADAGTEPMRDTSKSIQDGAHAFIAREYTAVGVFVAAMVVLITIVLRHQHGWMIAICYVVGAISSLLAGFLGLMIATRANTRTAQAATKSTASALQVAFRSGAFMGFIVAGFGLLGLTVLYLVFKAWVGVQEAPNIILGFALGASSVALFARVGGGIFTKSADIGADMVGIVEEGIPEDDPRNPAAIADNVGDNVGNVAGMGADLYESYIAAIIAPVTIAAAGAIFRRLGEKAMVLPLAITALGIICSIIGALLVRPKGDVPRWELTWPPYVTALLAAVGSFFLVWGILGKEHLGLFWPVLMGIVAGMAIGLVNEYYTNDSFKPVREIARSAKTGGGTAILSGISFGMLATVIPVGITALAIGVSYVMGSHALGSGGGIYGVGIAALGMLCTTGIVVAVDAFGPVADNAYGIAQMTELDPEVLASIDKLDSIGNTTTSLGKGFAIGSAVLGALALFAAYAQAIGLAPVNMFGDYKFIVGILLGAVTPFVFAALVLAAVGRGAFAVVEEARRQFREIEGLREGAPGAKPDSIRCIDIANRSALHNMFLPCTIAIIAPMLVGFFLGKEALAGFLAGAIAVGFLLAVMMAISGGAWSNAKKLIERGEHGGKGTAAHAASIIGDTLGDPFKDTAGPAMNILIKVMAVVSLVFVPLFMK